MLSGHGESVFVSVMHEGSDMAVYCFAIDDWLSVCQLSLLPKRYVALTFRLIITEVLSLGSCCCAQCCQWVGHTAAVSLSEREEDVQEILVRHFLQSPCMCSLTGMTLCYPRQAQA